MFSRCLPYAETEKAESSLWENRRFFVSGFFASIILYSFSDSRPIFQSRAGMSRQISSQKG